MCVCVCVCVCACCGCGSSTASLQSLSLWAVRCVLFVPVTCICAHQVLMVELLLSHGANPAAIDAHNATPDAVAKQNGFTRLGSRLRLATFEIAEAMYSFVDHTTVHAHTPSEQKAGASLSRLSSTEYENIVQDTFDELQRRETEQALFASLEQEDRKKLRTPFLPLNPALPSKSLQVTFARIAC